jgi:DNA-binding transcriptional MerR regulator
MRQRQLELFTRSELASMRDRTASRRYSPEGDQFRRDHKRHRAWGLTQRHARRLMHLRQQGDPWAVAISEASTRQTTSVSEPVAAGQPPTGAADGNPSSGRRLTPRSGSSERAARLVERVAYAQRTERAQQVDRTEPAEPTKPAGLTKPAEQAKPLGPSRPAGPTKPAHGHGKVGECAAEGSVLMSRVDLTGRARLR